MTIASTRTVRNRRRLLAAGNSLSRIAPGLHDGQPCSLRRLSAAGYCHARSTRAGFSLLEVILALGILAGAVATLGEVVRHAMESARIARDSTIAQLLCESKMAEITAGITLAEPVIEEPFDTTDDPTLPDWLYTIEVESIDTEAGLFVVRVTVVKDVPTEKRPASFSLTRWLLDSSAVVTSEPAAETTGE